MVIKFYTGHGATDYEGELIVEIDTGLRKLKVLAGKDVYNNEIPLALTDVIGQEFRFYDQQRANFFLDHIKVTFSTPVCVVIQQTTGPGTVHLLYRCH